MTEHRGQERSGKQAAPEDKRSTEQRLADLELQLAQTRAGIPGGTLPDNGGGVGDDVAETWSQYDQELANAGEHPDQQESQPRR
jgi:hypothetical protein